jgi:hypothetical protein
MSMPEPPRRAAVERLLPLEAIAEASVAELQQASDILRTLLEADGADLPQQRSILEVGYRELAAVAAVFGTVERLWARPDLQDKRLIDVLKVTDQQQVRWCLHVLAWSGLVVVDPTPPQLGAARYDVCADGGTPPCRRDRGRSGHHEEP